MGLKVIVAKDANGVGKKTAAEIINLLKGTSGKRLAISNHNVFAVWI